MTPSPSFYSSFCGTSPSSINIILSGLTHQREWVLKRHLSIITSGSHCHDYLIQLKKMCRKVLKIKNLSFSDLDKNTLPAKPGQFDLPIWVKMLLWWIFSCENISLRSSLNDGPFPHNRLSFPVLIMQLFIFYCAEQPLSTVDSVTDPPLICSLLVQISFHDLNNDANQETNTLNLCIIS